MFHGIFCLYPSVALIPLPCPLRFSEGGSLLLVQAKDINMGAIHVVPEGDTVYGFGAIASNCWTDYACSVVG